MDSFEEWVKARPDPCVQKWADLLVDLGASWDTFRREKSETIEALVDGGIPKLAAQDIWNVASEALSRSQAPLSIFWDIENMPIPTAVSGNEVAARLKTILSPHGRLVQFRGYASIGLNHIPETKRSELQLSGCHLVDCPHNGRKEVADKMIIVDALKFAYTNQEGATLCFITGDVDYAYLLAELQQPQWTTIVISKGTIQSMLHVNCDKKMRWETDVLQLRLSPSPHKHPPGFKPLSLEIQQVPMKEEFEAPIPSITAGNKSFAAVLGSEGVKTGGTAQEVACDDSLSSFETLTIAEEFTDDAELLRSIVANGTNIGENKGPSGTLKSYVGQQLRTINPARFPDRSALQVFLAKAIATGIVVETGEGGDKLLHLPNQYDGSAVPAIKLSEKAPISVEDMPEKAIALGSIRPYILFLQKYCIPQGSNLPDKAFVQDAGKWMIIMFQKLTEAQRAVAAKPWLRTGILVDWRRARESSTPKLAEKASPETTAVETIPCNACEGLCLKTDLFVEPGTDGCFCRSCFMAREYWSQREQANATGKVVSMLKMMADNDDMFIAKNILRSVLAQRWPSTCASRGQAALWIECAIEAGAVVEMKRQGVKVKFVCLPNNVGWVCAPYPSDDNSTTEEEEYVKELLWTNQFCLPRNEVNARVKEKFPRMNTPMLRTKMFLNAANNGSFFVAKGPCGQMVVLSKEDAEMALSMVSDASVANDPPSDEANDVDSSSEDSTASLYHDKRLPAELCKPGEGDDDIEKAVVRHVAKDLLAARLSHLAPRSSWGDFEPGPPDACRWDDPDRVQKINSMVEERRHGTSETSLPDKENQREDDSRRDSRDNRGGGGSFYGGRGDASRRQSKPQTDEHGFTVVASGQPLPPRPGGGGGGGGRTPSRSPPPPKSAGPPPLSKEKLEQKVKNMKAEYMADGDEKELLLTMDELESTPNAGQTLVLVNTDAAMDCKDAEREAIIEMLSILAENGKLSRSDFEPSMGELVEFIDSFVIDSPRAFQYLGDMLAEFIRVKVLDVPWLCRQCAKLKELDAQSSAPEKVIVETIESMRRIDDVGVDGAKSHFGSSSQSALETLLGAYKWNAICSDKLA